MCDIGYIVMHHIDAVLQVLTNRLRDYHMKMIKTKCLNTAVMMMYLMLGTEAMGTVHKCDVQNVRSRRKAKGDAMPTTGEIARNLKAAIQSKVAERALYYVMITDGKMAPVTPERAGQTAYFPGHVFVIERLKRGTCNLYQSYINQYDMAENIKDNKSLSIGRKRMTFLLDGLVSLMEKNAWDAECTKFWKELTNVDAPQFEGFQIHGTLLMCFRQVVTNNCLSKLKILVDQVLEELHTKKPDPDAVYGDPNLYGDAIPLTNAQMLKSMTELRDKM